jgi:hypothetical protein
MTPESFCYWLKGWFELNDAHGFDKFEPSIQCVDTIKAHLDLVFVNVTKPNIPDRPSLCDQDVGQDVHECTDTTILCQTKEGAQELLKRALDSAKFTTHKEETLYC